MAAGLRKMTFLCRWPLLGFLSLVAQMACIHILLNECDMMGYLFSQAHELIL
jgi:hypothetical protein